MHIKNITHIQNGRFIGWRFTFNRWGHSFTKYFSHGRYGGFEESLEAAKDFRNNFYSYIRENGDTEESIKEFILDHGTPSQRKKLGVDEFMGYDKRVASCVRTIIEKNF